MVTASTTTTSVKLIIGGGTSASQAGCLTTTLDQAKLLLSVLQSKTLSSVETAEGTTLTEELTNSSDFWKNLFAALSD